MLDINGVLLTVGDEVVYTNRNLNGLCKGKVFKITKSRAVIQIQPSTNHSYTDAKTGKVVTWISKHEHNIMSEDQVMKL